MHAKPYHFIIPTTAVFVAVLGSVFTQAGMAWYSTLRLPSLTPPEWVFPIAWTTIYVLTAGSAFIVWHDGPKKILHLFSTHHAKEEYRWLQWLFGINAVLNVGWTVVFFWFHWLGLAVFEIMLLELTIVVMIALSWKVSRTAAWLLVPYAVWVCLAMYLTMRIAFLN